MKWRYYLAIFVSAAVVGLIAWAALALRNVCPESALLTDVVFEYQGVDDWCWAASGAMVMNFVAAKDCKNPPSPPFQIQQCMEAQLTAPGQMPPPTPPTTPAMNTSQSCCVAFNARPIDTNAIAANCQANYWPKDAFTAYKFKFSESNKNPDDLSALPAPALSWAQVMQQLGCNGRPFAFASFYDDGTGHMMVAVGYKTTQGVNLIGIDDPLAADDVPGAKTPTTYIPYDDSSNGDSSTNSYVGNTSTNKHWADYYDISYTGCQG